MRKACRLELHGRATGAFDDLTGQFAGLGYGHIAQSQWKAASRAGRQNMAIGQPTFICLLVRLAQPLSRPRRWQSCQHIDDREIGHLASGYAAGLSLVCSSETLSGEMPDGAWTGGERTISGLNALARRGRGAGMALYF